jgi:hypothetical protein
MEFLREKNNGILIFANWNSDLMTFQQRNSKKIQPEYPESETELEFCFQWGLQKLEPKIRIPNLGERLQQDLGRWQMLPYR